MMRFALGLVALSLFHGVCRAEAPANRDSTKAYGLLIIAGIDRFEYGPSDRLTMTMLIVNQTGEPITIPGATAFCPMAIIDERWCRADGTDCREWSEGECQSELAVPIPPGTTIATPFAINDFWPGEGNWVHSLGRVRFLNPWNDPTRMGADWLSVTYHRSPLLPVESIGWDRVKRLYR